MILRQNCKRLQSLRTLHSSSKAAAKAPLKPVVTPSSSVIAPFPPKSRPPENDPMYIHPPSSIKAGMPLKGIQILKDRPDIIAMPDDYYPDWLWEFLDDPKVVEERNAAKREIEKKKDIYLLQLREQEIEQELAEVKKSPPQLGPGEHRTEEEAQTLRREMEDKIWMLNREKTYDFPQFEMPPERSAKFHKKVNKEKIKQENYLRARGMR